MADMASVIPDLREIPRPGALQDKPSDGEVADDATPTLRVIRRQTRLAYERVSEALQNFIQSSDVRDALQEPIISVRGDRLVVRVKAERRRKVGGIVHDASNTGATVFVEPFSTVELCNEWRELASKRSASASAFSETSQPLSAPWPTTYASPTAPPPASTSPSPAPATPRA